MQWSLCCYSPRLMTYDGKRKLSNSVFSNLHIVAQNFLQSTELSLAPQEHFHRRNIATLSAIATTEASAGILGRKKKKKKKSGHHLHLNKYSPLGI